MSVYAVALRSPTRREILSLLSDSPLSRREIRDSVDAGKSAVYDSLKVLEENGLVRRESRDSNSKWRLTTLGLVIADSLQQYEGIESTLTNEKEFWNSHDISVIPHGFRLNLHDLEECTVVRSDPTHPAEVVETVTDRIRGSEGASFMASFYHQGYAEAVNDLLRDDREVRILVPEEVLQTIIDMYGNSTIKNGNLSVRTKNVDFGLGVLDDNLIIFLPSIGGGIDLESVVLAESPDSLRWGNLVFEYYWSKAEPMGEVLASSIV